MANHVLEVKNLTKKFGNFIAVNNISFSLEEGEILGVLGPNGAGKTTTIQMLLGVLIPTQGTISYFGKDFETDRQETLRQINFASTYISLPWAFTIKEILTIFTRLYNVDQEEKRIKKLLAAFEIEYLENTNYYKLSAGEKTRVILAKAFLNYPRVILLDEPTASLDPEIAVKVREFLKEERKEYSVSMFLTSHNMAEVEEMCDRVLIINHGKIIAQDTPENLANNISDCKVELTISDLRKAEEFFEEKHYIYTRQKHRFTVTVDEQAIAEFLILLTKKNIIYQEISINKPQLEDYFLKVLGEKI